MSREAKSIVPGNGLAVKVLGNNRGDVEYALRMWKRKVKDAHIVEQLRDKLEYITPSAVRRKQRQSAIRKRKFNKD